jgi:hypothetical protein
MKRREFIAGLALRDLPARLRGRSRRVRSNPNASDALAGWMGQTVPIQKQ